MRKQFIYTGVFVLMIIFFLVYFNGNGAKENDFDRDYLGELKIEKKDEFDLSEEYDRIHIYNDEMFFENELISTFSFV